MAKFSSLTAVVMLWYIVGTNCQDCSGRPPAMQSPNECCKLNFNSQQEECIRKVIDKWNAFHQSSNKENFDMSEMCSSNCFLNANVLTSDNKVNTQEVKNVLEKILGAELQSMMPNMIETCKDRIDNGPGPRGPGDGKPPGEKKGPNCNMPMEILSLCLREQLMINCPDSSWNNGEQCNNMRTYMKNCPFGKKHGPGGPQGQQ